MHSIRFSLAFFLSVFLLTNLVGCAHQAMDYSISSWQNKPVTAVIASWGNPSEELRVNGKRLLLWNTPDSKAGIPSEKNGVHKTGTVGCVRLLEVDKSGSVIAGTWDGKECPGWFSGWYW